MTFPFILLSQRGLAGCLKAVCRINNCISNECFSKNKIITDKIWSCSKCTNNRATFQQLLMDLLYRLLCDYDSVVCNDTKTCRNDIWQTRLVVYLVWHIYFRTQMLCVKVCLYAIQTDSHYSACKNCHSRRGDSDGATLKELCLLIALFMTRVAPVYGKGMLRTKGCALF